jgi:hypothetical protein
LKPIEFTQFVRDVSYYFQRKMPADRTIELWYEDVKHIQAQRLPEIFKAIKNGESPPYNLAGAMLTVYNGSARNAGNGIWQPTAADYLERDRFDEAKRRFDALPPGDQRKRMIQVVREFGLKTEHALTLKPLVRTMAIWNMAKQTRMEVVK